MKKTVIAIFGTANNGKTSSIKAIATAILDRFPDAKPDYKANGAEITLIIKIGTLKIGISSQGDPGTRLHERLDLFVTEKCKIIICATRSSGGTVNNVNDLHNSHGYDIIWTSNYFSNEKSKPLLNDFFAKSITDLIQEMISGRI